jgi:hypothetical protein
LRSDLLPASIDLKIRRSLMESPVLQTDELRLSILNSLSLDASLDSINAGSAAKGMEDSLSRQVIGKIALDMGSEHLAIWKNKMKSAGILCAIGLAITGGSYVLFAGEGLYLLARGPMVFGLIRMAEAFIKCENAKANIAKAEKFARN